MNLPSSIKLADEEMQVLPTTKSKDITFDQSLSVICINRRGTLLAIGQSDGQLIVYDALTLGNAYDYQRNEHRVTSISFSPDSHFLASGDSSGTLFIHDTVTKVVNRTEQFEAGIIQVQVCKSKTNLVILLANHLLVLYNLGDNSRVNFAQNLTRFASVYNDGSFFGIYQKKVFVFTEENPAHADEIPITQLPGSRGYQGIECSPSGELFVLFDQGAAHLYTRDGVFVVTYRDPCQEMRYTCGCFWMDGYHVFMGCNRSSKSGFVGYIANGREIVCLDMLSSKIPAFQLLANPQKPWLYIMGKRTLQLWLPSRDRLIPTCPIGQQMIDNEEYYEKEDEWDKTNAYPRDSGQQLFRRNIFLEEEDQHESAPESDEIMHLPCVWD